MSATCNPQKGASNQLPPQAATIPAASGSPAQRTFSTKRRYPTDGRRRGLKEGAKLRSNTTNEDWFIACQTYRKVHRELHQMTQKDFLSSDLSADIFQGTLSEQQSFSRMLKRFDSGELKPTLKKRDRKRKFETIEMFLIDYLDLRAKAYKHDKSDIPWTTIQHKCLQFAELLEGKNSEFKASAGWIADTLKRHGKLGTNLPGKVNNMSGEGRAKMMSDWLEETLNKGKVSQATTNDKDTKPLATLMEAEVHIEEVRRYAKSRKLSASVDDALDFVSKEIRREALSQQLSAPAFHQNSKSSSR